MLALLRCMAAGLTKKGIAALSPPGFDDGAVDGDLVEDEADDTLLTGAPAPHVRWPPC